LQGVKKDKKIKFAGNFLDFLSCLKQIENLKFCTFGLYACSTDS